MDVRNGNALSEASETTNLDVLADDQNHLLLLLQNGAALSILSSHQSVQISGVSLCNGSGNTLNEVNELLVLSNEVGLSVNLDHNTDTVDGGSISHTLSSDTASLLLRSSQALFAQVLNSLIHITVGSSQSLLAVHHANAGHLAQILNISCSKCHFIFLLSIE